MSYINAVLNYLVSSFTAVRVKLLMLPLLLSGCAALPQKNIYTEIDINAPKEVVWDILADNDTYGDWNPYHVSVVGDLREGESLAVKIVKPNGNTVEIEPHVIKLVPMEELTWGGGIKGIFFGEHVFALSTTKSGQTRLIQRESFSGLAIPFAELDAIEAGYSQMNLALKRRAEAIVNKP